MGDRAARFVWEPCGGILRRGRDTGSRTMKIPAPEVGQRIGRLMVVNPEVRLQGQTRSVVQMRVRQYDNRPARPPTGRHQVVNPPSPVNNSPTWLTLQGRRRTIMRIVSRLLLVIVAALALVLVTVPVTSARATVPPTIIKIATGHHPGYDRVTFTFANGALPAERSWAYVPQLIADASGQVIPIEGHAIIRVRFFSASTEVTATQTPRLPEIRQVKAAGNFEGVVSYGIGVTKQEPVTMHVLAGPTVSLNRIYFDIRTP
jgi:hypothetical protein